MTNITPEEKESLRERMSILVADLKSLALMIQDLRSENERLRNLCSKYERIHNALQEAGLIS